MSLIRLGPSPNMREFQVRHGNVIIESITVCKSPIQKTFDTILNIVSFGTWASAKAQYSYDDLFHLYLIVVLVDKTIVRIEKNQVIIMSSVPDFKPPDNTRYIDIDSYEEKIKSGRLDQLTINTIMKMAEIDYGLERIYLYSANRFNCQQFLLDLLIANEIIIPTKQREPLEPVNGFIPTSYFGQIGITNEDDKIYEFINQNSSQLFNQMPRLIGTAVNGLTDVAATVDRILYGAGVSNIQTVLFDNSKFSEEEAEEFLEEHKIKPIKSVHYTTNYLRYRIKDPKEFKKFYTKSIEDGIKFVIGSK